MPPCRRAESRVYSQGVLPLDCRLEFDLAREEEFFASLPPRPAVFALEPSVLLGSGVAPYLSRTGNLRRRLERLLGAPAEGSPRLNLRGFAGAVCYRLTGSDFEQTLIFYQHARRLFPSRFRDWARLRPPALVKVNLANPYPRCYVTRRIISDGGFYFGPFPTRRAAETFLVEFLSLFRVRRCLIRIRRDPSFPGCIYSEMKMCLAPCFAGCTKAEYDVEVERLTGFLASAGNSLLSELEGERMLASEATDYERAAAVHKRHAKVAAVVRGLPELAGPLQELEALVLQRAAEENTVALFVVRGGLIDDPFFLRFDELASQPRSAEQILRERLEAGGNATERAEEEVPENASGVLADHVSILSRWYYANPHDGEVFFAARFRSGSRSRSWPYRRIIRACSRLLRPRAEGKPASLPFPPENPPETV